MLKRQRPATPPPSFLGDPLSDGLLRPIPPPQTVDSSQPRSKRQRVRPPPLDGALRGWLQSEPAGSHWESDGEEDWTEDAHDVSGSSLPPSTTADQYKDANTLLHDLHVLNQHRLLFAHSPPPRDRRLNPGTRLPPLTAHTPDPHAVQRPVVWTDGPPYHPAHPLSRDKVDGPSYFGFTGEKGLTEEVRCVRQRYEDTNRMLGSLFLSRRREVEEIVCIDHSPSS